MNTTADGAQSYYPPPESGGGWRGLDDPVQTRPLAGIDVEALAPARAWNRQHGVPSSVVIIHRGHLVAEWYENGAGPETRFNIHSCTKSLTGTAYGILFDDVRRGKLAAAVDLDSPAYAYIPAGHPLTDPRKERIALRHLLSMSSGIPGESIGAYGLPTAPGINPFAAALGFHPVLARGTDIELWVSHLVAEPGARWDYCDPAFAHLALAFREIAGQELAQFMAERVFRPIGIESLTWETLGLDDGGIGRHTNPFSGAHVSAREMARIGYLMLRRGIWEGQSLVPSWWIDLSTRTSQAANGRYGLTWWVNTQGTLWPAASREAYSALGYNTNLCTVIPSLDLVIVRVGAGPTESTENTAPPFIATIVGAVMDRDRAVV
jgi:CubicO group peptidase (beta-lactamase class C family)